jgi:putative inorganic carbon (hco3(-)) transporter
VSKFDKATQSGRGQLITYLLLFTYLTFLGGTVYTDMNFKLRVAHQLIMSAILAVWLIGLVRRRDEWPWTGLELPIFVFMGVRLASSLAGIDPRMSVEFFWRPFTHLLLFYWLVWLLRGNQKRLVVRAFFLVMGVVCIMGIIEFIGWYLGLPFLPMFQEGWLQIGGLSNPIPPSSWRLNFTLASATSLSTYLSLLIPPAIAMAIRTRRRDNRVGWLLLVSLGLVVQVLTRSRGGLLALFVSAVVTLITGVVLWRDSLFVLWRRLKRSRLFWFSCALASLIVLALVIVLLPNYIDRVHNLIARVELWKCAAQTMAEHPLLGVGTGGFGRAWRTCAETSPLKYDFYTAAHNLYLNMAAESGMAGIGALGLLMTMLALRIKSRWECSRDTFDRIEVIAIAAALVGYAANCFFDTLTMTPLVLPVIFLVAWLVAPLQQATMPAWRSRWIGVLMLLVLAVYLAGLLWVDLGQRHFEQGLTAARQGDYGSALASVEAAQRVDPRLELYRFQGAFYLGRLAHDDPEEYLQPAIAAQRAALELEDSSSIHLANLAALHWQNSELDQAIEVVERALEKVPPEPTLWLNYGLMAEQAGRGEQALDAYAHALADRPQWASSGFWQETAFRGQSLAEILLRAAEWSEDPFSLWFAADELERALASVSAPRTGIEFQQRGQVRLQQGALENARADLTRAIELCPRCVGAYISRSRIYWELGLLEEAERDARTAIFISSHGAARAYQTLAWIVLEEGDVEAAISLLRRAVPPRIGDYNWEAVLYNRRGDLGLLPQLVQIEGGVDTFAPWLELAELYLSLDRPDEAIRVYQLVLARDPFVPGVQEQLTALEGH